MTQTHHNDATTIIARLVSEWPSNAPDSALEEARLWLDTHKSGQRASDIRALAHNTLVSLDALLRALQGGAAFDVLLDARKALARFVHQEPARDEAELVVKFAPTGEVTLLREGHHFTIEDEELDQVRDAVNYRKREIRKRQRRSQG
jgi:hypothetical protein